MAAHTKRKESVMRRTSLTLALVLVAVVAASSLPASAQPGRHETRCTRVAGEFAFTMFRFTSETTAVGVGVVRGDLAGTFHAHYWDIVQRANGVIETRGSHVLTTSRGTVVTLDAIRLLPDTQPNSGFVLPDSRLHILGGTRSYKNTGGLLRTNGRVNLTTLEGSIGYEGKICPAGEVEADDSLDDA
jgi:hypothetical protein